MIPQSDQQVAELVVVLERTEAEEMPRRLVPPSCRSAVVYRRSKIPNVLCPTVPYGLERREG